MADSRIPSKTVAATIQDPHVLDMFNSVVGGSNGETWSLPVIYGKQASLATEARRFVKVLSVLAAEDSPLRLFPSAWKQVGALAERLRDQLEELPKAPDLTRWVSGSTLRVASEMSDAGPFDRIPLPEKQQFGAAYLALKVSGPVKLAICACSTLSAFKGSLSTEEKLGDAFLRRTPTVPLLPLQDLKELDYRLMYNSSLVDADGRRALLMSLHKMLTIGHAVYEHMMSPDVNVAEFVDTVVESIGKLRGQIPRCDQAFDKILESVSMLRQRFGEYHRDFAISGKPAVIMENFVLDVAKSSSGNSPTLAFQFRQIVKHYKKEADAQRSSDRRMRAVFEAISTNLRLASGESKAEDEPPSGADPGEPGSPARIDEGDSKKGPSAATLRTRRKKARARVKRQGAISPRDSASPESAGLDSSPGSAELESAPAGEAPREVPLTEPNPSPTGEVPPEVSLASGGALVAPGARSRG